MKTIHILSMVIASFIGAALAHLAYDSKVNAEVHIAEKYKRLFPSHEVTVAKIDKDPITKILKEFDDHPVVYNLVHVTVQSPTNAVDEYLIGIIFNGFHLNGTLNENYEWSKGRYTQGSSSNERLFTSASLKTDPNIEDTLHKILAEISTQVRTSKTLRKITM